MKAGLKKELVEYVLLKAPVWLLNDAIRDFSTQRLYSRYKRELMSDYKELMPGNLKYAIVMAEAFREYECDGAKCKELRYKIDELKRCIKLVKRSNPARYTQLVDEHNSLVSAYSELIEPQQKLIKLYKKLHRRKTNPPAAVTA